MMTSPSSKHVCRSVPLSCHCNSWLHNGQPSSKHDFRSVPLSSHVTDNYIRASPSAKHDFSSVPLSSHCHRSFKFSLSQTVALGPVPAPNTTWSVPLCCHWHSWLDHGQSQLQTRLLICSPYLSLFTVGCILTSPSSKHDCWSQCSRSKF